ncbi:MAG: MFS transporter [Armatimonadota bacterium]|nr:MAG: MFS transporter [Armatimonadota bacterium]
MLFPAIRASLSLTYGAGGVIYAVRTIIQTMSGPFWGFAADRYNRKWILVLGTGIWGTLMALAALATDYWELLFVRVIACIGLGALYPASFSMLADVFGPHRRGRAMGALGMIGMLGVVAAAVGFGQLLEVSNRGWQWGIIDLNPDTGWRWAFVILGAASVLAGILIALLVRHPVRGAAEPELEGVMTEADAARFRFRMLDVKEVLRSRTMWVNLVQGCFLMTTLNSLSIYFVTWLVDDRGFAEGQAPIIFGGMVLALAIGSLVGGIACDVADERWPHHGRAALSQVSIALSFPAMWYMITAAEELRAILACGVFAGFFLEWTRRGVKQPLVQAVIRPEFRATAMAITEFFQGAVASVAVIGLGKFADMFESHGLTYALMVACGSWLFAGAAATAYYYVYPGESERFRRQMRERRELITGRTNDNARNDDG